MHIHKWGKWSEPFDLKLDSAYVPGSAQRRSCERCGKVQQRDIGTARRCSEDTGP